MKIYRDWCDVPIVLTTEIAADITGEYVKTVSRLCREGKIKAVRRGKRWFIPKESLMEYCGVNGSVWNEQQVIKP